jgi:hypothetical protein
MGMRECVTCHSHARLVAIREASFADEWAYGEAEVFRGCQWRLGTWFSVADG